eukprot:CAMPEP_0117443222 /NCGR_PEP_ID=MMETSP0759-20121206/4579_1 /TAXON_ID=63605 /ORGANISM="Percolomonas cosmopolitus, Strain WS" /LENGTH=1173 /DNA_ID=CAMNT_0005235181 /DNA_START=460 /DNA_END=3981 /DNA_ORIENTATION=-
MTLDRSQHLKSSSGNNNKNNHSDLMDDDTLFDNDDDDSNLDGFIVDEDDVIYDNEEEEEEDDDDECKDDYNEEPPASSSRKRKRAEFVPPRRSTRRSGGQSDKEETKIVEEEIENADDVEEEPVQNTTRDRKTCLLTNLPQRNNNKGKRKKRKREYASANLFSKQNVVREEATNERLRKQRKEEARQREALLKLEEEERQQGQEADTPQISKKWINLSDAENKILLSDLAAKTVKPHQLSGLRFLWKHVVEEDSGAILAHAMGLGKSLQSILFIELFLQQQQGTHIMISAPNSVISSWEKEIEDWSERLKLKHLPQSNLYNFSEFSSSQQTKRITMLKEYQEKGGILLISQNIIYQLQGKTRSKNKETIERLEKRFKKNEEILTQAFISPGPDLLIVDEVSSLKNDENLFYAAVAEVDTRRRILLTGTPLQNNLREMYALVTFVRPGFWDLEQFRDIFIEPIRNGSLKDSSEPEVRVMKWRSFILVTQLKAVAHRENQRILVSSLPKKREFVLMVKTTRLQGKLIAGLLTYLNAGTDHQDIQINSSGQERVKGFGSLLKCVSILHKVINSPDLLRRYMVEHKIAYASVDGVAPEDRETQQDREFVGASDEEEADTDEEEGEVDVALVNSDSDSDIEVVTTQTTTTSTTTHAQPISLVDDNDDDLLTMSLDDISSSLPARPRPQESPLRIQRITIGGTQQRHSRQRKKKARVQSATVTCRAKDEIKDFFNEGQRLYIDMEHQHDYEWAQDVLGADYPIASFQNNTKMQLVYGILKKALNANRKVLLFSQYTSTLDVVETFFKKYPILGENLRPDLTYLRMDGKTRTKKRKQLIEWFNDEDWPCKVFLLSTKAGGIGLNLQAASVLILMDINWNPTNDQQALCRSFRFGQKQNVHVYRLVGAGTAEDSIYKKALNKVWLSRRVVDDEVNKRFLEFDQVFKFKFSGTKEIEQDREIHPSYKDDFILKDLFEENQELIQGIYPHEGLYVEDPEGMQSSAEEMQESIRDFEDSTNLDQTYGMGARARAARAHEQRRTLLDELSHSIFRTQLLRIMELVQREELVRVIVDMWNTTEHEANDALDVLEKDRDILPQQQMTFERQLRQLSTPAAALPMNTMAVQQRAARQNGASQPNSSPMTTQPAGNSQYPVSQHTSSQMTGNISSQRGSSFGGGFIDLT